MSAPSSRAVVMQRPTDRQRIHCLRCGPGSPWIDPTEHGGFCAKHAAEKEERRIAMMDAMIADLDLYTEQTGDPRGKERADALRREEALGKHGDWSWLRKPIVVDLDFNRRYSEWRHG